MEIVKTKNRLFAYIFDIIIVFFIISLINQIKFLNPNYDKYIKTSQEYSELLSTYSEGEIDIKEFNESSNNYYYFLSKYGISNNIVTIIVLILYYVLFQKYNNGQTIGKRLYKIKVVDEEGNNPGIIKYLLRILFSYYTLIGGFIPLIINTILILCLKKKLFLEISSIISSLFLIIFIISIVLIIFSKNKKSIHDLISKTKVVNS